MIDPNIKNARLVDLEGASTVQPYSDMQPVKVDFEDESSHYCREKIERILRKADNPITISCSASRPTWMPAGGLLDRQNGARAHPSNITTTEKVNRRPSSPRRP